jgi:hypothetical protein
MRKSFTIGLAVVMSVALLAAGSAWAQGPLKVGEEAPAFILPSSQEKLVDYYKDYYGRHHLILTFFPAAFTPV